MKRFINLGLGNNLKTAMKFIDIGVNLTDGMFQGKYNGSAKHESDLDKVLERAWGMGMQKMIITIGTLKEAEEALDIANKDERLFVTMGCHPTRCNDFVPNPEQYYLDICKKIEDNPTKVVAIGECGLDYDRLQFCEKETQKLYFEKQLNLAEKYKLPLFLHSRNAEDDFLDIVSKNKDKFAAAGGVVHSFTGSLKEALDLIDMGFYISLNGCSLKTEENLQVVREIPVEKILIETDCPWCGVRRTHAGSTYLKSQFPTKKKEKWTAETLVDGRNEPCQILHVLEIIAGIKEESVEKLADIFYQNTIDLFFKNH